MTWRQPNLREAKQQLEKISAVIAEHEVRPSVNRGVYPVAAGMGFPERRKYGRSPYSYCSSGIYFYDKRWRKIVLRYPFSSIEEKCRVCGSVLRDRVDGDRFKLVRSLDPARHSSADIGRVSSCIRCWNKYRRVDACLREINSTDVTLRKARKGLKDAERQNRDLGGPEGISCEHDARSPQRAGGHGQSRDDGQVGVASEREFLQRDQDEAAAYHGERENACSREAAARRRVAAEINQIISAEQFA